MGRLIKRISWTNRALKDLKKVKDFNAKIKGKQKAKEMAQRIFDEPKILENPNFDYVNIGSIDESFDKFKREYRKIFSEGCKITYREGKTKIYITRVFDTRQHPNKNK